MVTLTGRMLADLLKQCRWAPEQDFGYRWHLGPADPARFSLHLLADPTDDTTPGLLFARERGVSPDARGVLLSAAVSTRRTEALTATLFADSGDGDLRALATLLDATDAVDARPAPAV